MHLHPKNVIYLYNHSWHLVQEIFAQLKIGISFLIVPKNIFSIFREKYHYIIYSFYSVYENSYKYESYIFSISNYFVILNINLS